MILEGGVSILINDDGMRIEVEDRKSRTAFIRLKLNRKQTCQALSRLCTTCEMDIRGLDRVGKRHEHKVFEFKMPPSEYKTRKKIAVEEVKRVCPTGWIPDIGFSSQNSFFNKGKYEERDEWARTTIRRYV